MTSTDDKNVQIYPLATWLELVGGLQRGKRDDPLLRQFLMKTNYNGQKARVGRHGRVKIPGFLRHKIRPDGEIAIEEGVDHLELMPVRM